MSLAIYFLLLIYFFDFHKPCQAAYSTTSQFRMRNKIRELDLDLLKDSMMKVKTIMHLKPAAYGSTAFQAGEVQYTIREQFILMMRIYENATAKRDTTEFQKQLESLQRMHHLSINIDTLVQILEDEMELERRPQADPNLIGSPLGGNKTKPSRFGEDTRETGGKPPGLRKAAPSALYIGRSKDRDDGVPADPPDSVRARRAEILKKKWLMRKKLMGIENKNKNKNGAMHFETGFDSDIN